MMTPTFLLITLATFVILLPPAARGGRPIDRQRPYPHDTLPERFQPRPRPRPAETLPVPVNLPHHKCTCDEARLTKVGQDIAGLVRRMEEQETRSAENKESIQTLGDSNLRLQSQIPRLVGENQRLTRQTHSLQSNVNSLSETNRQLRAENERLGSVRGQQGPLNEDPPQHKTRSSLRNLNDVTGNQEAELIEMGVFPPVRPARPGRVSPDSRPAIQVPDAEQIASSLLMLNRQNEVLTRKIEQLEGRTAPSIPGPQARPPPPGQSPSELADKISELERLVLVSFQNPSGRTTSFSGQDGPPAMGRPGPQGRQHEASRRQLSDEDLEAMENVVARVRNSSPAKSAFSFASTGITLGTANDPRAIEFDHEFVNKGGDFNTRRSRFVCENTGFYYITFTLRSYDKKYLGVVLMKNDELQTAVYADKSDRNIMQTQSVILQLETGDELWLRHAPSEHFAVHSGQHRYVTFSGYLIYRGR